MKLEPYTFQTQLVWGKSKFSLHLNLVVSAGVQILGGRGTGGSRYWRQQILVAADTGSSRCWRQQMLAAADVGGSRCWRQQMLVAAEVGGNVSS